MGAHRSSAHAGPEALAAARAAFPTVEVPDDAFAAFLDARAGDEPFSAAALEALYLTCALVRGDAKAARAFDDRYLPGARRALARMRLSADDTDELVQRLREDLLVAKPDAPPRIAAYDGRGDLEGFLRVTVVRSALKLKRKQGPTSEDGDARLAARAGEGDPELSYMKELYRDAFKSAFHAAIDALDARDKNLLRQHFVDGLTVDDLGKMYGVHRATAARWVQKARDELLKSTRKGFAERTKVGSRECDSVLRLVQSRLDVTLRRLLV